MSTSSPQRAERGAPSASAFHRRAATVSVVAPLAAVGIRLFVEPQTQGIQWLGVTFGVTCALLILVGLVLGIIALAATKRHGREGIFCRAVVGICIASMIILFTLLSIPDMIRQSETKRSIYRQMMEQKP